MWLNSPSPSANAALATLAPPSAVRDASSSLFAEALASAALVDASAVRAARRIRFASVTAELSSRCVLSAPALEGGGVGGRAGAAVDGGAATGLLRARRIAPIDAALGGAALHIACAFAAAAAPPSSSARMLGHDCTRGRGACTERA